MQTHNVTRSQDTTINSCNTISFQMDLIETHPLGQDFIQTLT
jgi:hypothetical protein